MTAEPVSAGPGLAALLPELAWRGILHATTPGLPDRLASGRPIAGYIGFDPSAPSLHVGHLVPIFGLLRLQRFGGRPVAVVGGGTGMIGDPSGRSSERNLLDRETLEANVSSIRAQLERFLDFGAGGGGALMVNNLDWLGELTLIEFLRDVGKHFTVPYMLAKDSVQVRLDRGLSFTEFSYMLLQAADFEHLHRTMGVELQMGGADQWGNITAGLELIRRRGGVEEGGGRSRPMGWPTSSCSRRPARSSARARAASRSGSIPGGPRRSRSTSTGSTPMTGTWARTCAGSPSSRARRSKRSRPRCASRPEAREAQRALARDITTRTHGPEAATSAEQQAVSVFDRGLVHLGPDEFAAAAAELPRVTLAVEPSWTAAGTAVASGAASSNGEARRLVSQGGLYINDERITDPNAPLPEPLHGRYWVIRTGKKNTRILERA